jgi:hypothetical protein
LKIIIKSSILAIAVFFICLVLSWHFLSKANFFFDTLYDMHQIESHIAEFAPQNRQNRINFELTSKNERIRIVGKILRTVNSKGVGLETIKYFNTDGVPVNLFLTLAEVEHLKDVSVLVHLMNSIAFILMIIFIIIFSLAWRYKTTTPSLLMLTCSMVGFVIITTGCIIFIGPQIVFNELHEWVFADKSEWHFYYQDSLMTTLLKAPDTFATIAILMTAIALIFWLLIFCLTKKLLK